MEPKHDREPSTDPTPSPSTADNTAAPNAATGTTAPSAPPPGVGTSPSPSAADTTHRTAATAPPAAASTSGKADVGKRFIAAVIDGLIAFVVGLIPWIGGIIGAAYMIARDGLDVDFMRQRSIGKQMMKLRPVRLDGKPMDIETSFRRNWMFGLGALTSLLLYIPIIGWVLIPFVALVALGIGIFEIYKVLTDPEGRRWGDALAGTKVIEVSE